MKHHTIRSVLLTAAAAVLIAAACTTPPSDDVVPAPPTSAPVPEGVRVYVDAIDVLIMESFPVQVTAVVRGNLPDGCSRLGGASATRVDDVFTLTFDATSEGDVCTEAQVPFEKNVPLDVLGLQTGTYRVIGGDIETSFTLDMDNSTVDASAEAIQDLRGTVTSVEMGADGVQVELSSDDTLYSVTISVIQATVFGQFDAIKEGAELEVSGPVLADMEPTLVVAESVTVLGAAPDYVLNLRGTISAITVDGDSTSLELVADDGVAHQVTLNADAMVHGADSKEIQAGTPLWVSGDLDDSGHVAADVVLIDPNTAPGDGGIVPVHDEATVSGTVVVRPPSESDVVSVALPEGATVTVRLQDISRQDVAAKLLSEVIYEDMTQLPIDYQLPYAPNAVDDRMTYSVSAVVQDADGRMIYRSDTVHPVLTRGSGTAADIELISLQ